MYENAGHVVGCGYSGKEVDPIAPETSQNITVRSSPDVISCVVHSSIKCAPTYLKISSSCEFKEFFEKLSFHPAVSHEAVLIQPLCFMEDRIIGRRPAG
jgi:hypothetical protein